jgi:hypothetical protein
MEIADEKIGSGFHDARQLAYHGLQVSDMPYSKRADRQIEPCAAKRETLAGRSYQTPGYRGFAASDSQHCV